MKYGKSDSLCASGATPAQRQRNTKESCVIALFVSALGTVIFAAIFAMAQAQHSVMVFDAGCIAELAKSEKTKVEAPMIDGKPDLKHVTLKDPVLRLTLSCGHYEIRRDK